MSITQINAKGWFDAHEFKWLYKQGYKNLNQVTAAHVLFILADHHTVQSHLVLNIPYHFAMYV